MNPRDAKLVQWLTEAYVKEAELEADLTAHISLTEKDSYRKRLQDHLKETHEQKKRVGARIKQLGGSPTNGPEVPGVPSIIGDLAGKAVAAVKGQVGLARAAVTEQAETHMRNAQEELREEHVEIAIYTRIETLASELGDKETVRLARDIRRQEERMAKFLDAELVRLVKDVVKAEIPKEFRSAPRSGRSTGRKPAASKSASSRSSTASSRSSKRASAGSAKSASAGKSSRTTKAAAAKTSSSAKASSPAKANGAAKSSGSSAKSSNGSSKSASSASRSSAGSKTKEGAK